MNSQSTPNKPLRTFNPLVISGSAHVQGNTKQAVELLCSDLPTLFLCEQKIAHYSYTSSHEGDDFLPTMRRILAHDPLIFATPVYWYSMSGHMKVFWDRVTDLYVHHKDLGQQLKGKTAMIIVSSSSPMPQGFAMPLEKTFAYLKMGYVGCWDQIFPLEAHADHNQEQRLLAQTAWAQLHKDFENPSA
jgi:NAD(P)H-dependent FMN reductase